MKTKEFLESKILKVRKRLTKLNKEYRNVTDLYLTGIEGTTKRVKLKVEWFRYGYVKFLINLEEIKIIKKSDYESDEEYLNAIIEFYMRRVYVESVSELDKIFNKDNKYVRKDHLCYIQ